MIEALTLSRMGIAQYWPKKVLPKNASVRQVTLLSQAQNPAMLICLGNKMHQPVAKLLNLLQNILFCMNIEPTECTVVCESNASGAVPLENLLDQHENIQILSFGMDVGQSPLHTFDLSEVLLQPKMKKYLYEDIRALSLQAT